MPQEPRFDDVKERFCSLLREMLARLVEEPDEYSLGDILPLVPELVRLSDGLGFHHPPVMSLHYHRDFRPAIGEQQCPWVVEPWYADLLKEFHPTYLCVIGYRVQGPLRFDACQEVVAARLVDANPTGTLKMVNECAGHSKVKERAAIEVVLRRWLRVLDAPPARLRRHQEERVGSRVDPAGAPAGPPPTVDHANGSEVGAAGAGVGVDGVEGGPAGLAGSPMPPRLLRTMRPQAPHLTERQLGIWKALEMGPLLAKEISVKVYGSATHDSVVRGTIKRMRRDGRRIEWTRGRGYYRPDMPRAPENPPPSVGGGGRNAVTP
jgi:hypothetical protein